MTDRHAIDSAQLLRKREPVTVGDQDCIVLTLEERDVLAAELDLLHQRLAEAEQDREEGAALAREVNRGCAQVVPDLPHAISMIVVRAAAEGRSVEWACEQIALLKAQGEPAGRVH